MKVNKKIFISVFIVIVVLLIFIVIKFNTNDLNNKEDISMVEQYLNDKYNINLRIEDYDYYDNGNLGINAGKHYVFNFKSIQEFELHAKLDYMTLEKENLKYLILNITNIEKAKELKKYIEENSGLKCKVTEYRIIESENNYYVFRVELENNSNYWIMGSIYNTIENSKDIIISSSLKQRYNLEDMENMQFNLLLNKIRKEFNM
ncbi:MAG: hypothetical protein IJV31_10245 [Clostridia bacterium]|nr:hypothetical protein [Clostridia bacterium]